MLTKVSWVQIFEIWLTVLWKLSLLIGWSYRGCKWNCYNAYDFDIGGRLALLTSILCGSQLLMK